MKVGVIPENVAERIVLSDEMAAWQRAAGLLPQKPIRFRSVPGSGQQAAVKPAG